MRIIILGLIVAIFRTFGASAAPKDETPQFQDCRG